MEVAFTIDDLPRWPHADYPQGYTPNSIAERLIEALDGNGIQGVYAFANSAPLIEDPSLTGVMDRWVDAGHHVANHTHGHPDLLGVDADTYIEHIDLADQHLAPWTVRAPGRYFRYTRNHWGDTEDKLERVKTHLAKNAYRVAEVTTWFFEWKWNVAYERALASANDNAIDFLRATFLEFSVAQLCHDTEQTRKWFGRDVPGIILGHNVPFFADIADAFFAQLKAAGARFVSLDDIASDPAFDAAASGVTDQFLTYQQKLAHLEGKDMHAIAPAQQAVFDEVLAMGVQD